jgi:hypothetical protein
MIYTIDHSIFSSQIKKAISSMNVNLSRSQKVKKFREIYIYNRVKGSSWTKSRQFLQSFGQQMEDFQWRPNPWHSNHPN